MKRNKALVEIFIPLGSCICNYSALMEKVGHVTSKFKGQVEVKIRSTKSLEAFKYGIRDTWVTVDGNTKLLSDFNEKELEEAIKKVINALWTINVI